MRNLFAFLGLLFAGQAFAFGPATTPMVLTTGGGGATYQGPGDIHAFTAWYGLRGYSQAAAAAGTTKAVKLQRASDGEACDVLIATTGALGNTANCSGADNGESAAAFCSSTTCQIRTYYDQTGGNACGGSSCDLTTNGGIWPTLAFSTTNCISPITVCHDAAGSGDHNVLSFNYTPPSAVISLSGVAAMESTTTANSPMFPIGGIGSNNFISPAATDFWKINGGSSGSVSVAAARGAWHAANGVLNGASSALNVDGTDTTGTATASASSGAPKIGTNNPSGAFEMRSVEGGWIQGYALTATERGNLNGQQRAYWGF